MGVAGGLTWKRGLHYAVNAAAWDSLWEHQLSHISLCLPCFGLIKFYFNVNLTNLTSSVILHVWCSCRVSRRQTAVTAAAACWQLSSATLSACSNSFFPVWQHCLIGQQFLWRHVGSLARMCWHNNICQQWMELADNGASIGAPNAISNGASFGVPNGASIGGPRGAFIGGPEILWSRRPTQGRGHFFSAFKYFIKERFLSLPVLFSCSGCQLCRSKFRRCPMRCTLKTKRRGWLSSLKSLLTLAFPRSRTLNTQRRWVLKTWI